jgi:LacI family transcriptional regulator
MASSRHIAVVNGIRTTYTLGVVNGVWQWVRVHPGWMLESNVPDSDFGLNWILSRKWDGLLAYMSSDEIFKAIKKKRIPVVNVSNTLPPGDPYPRVVNDDFLTGQLAAEYFLKEGIRAFGCLGPASPAKDSMAELRVRGFCETIGKVGYKVDYHVPRFNTGPHSWLVTEIPGLSETVKSLQATLGMFCITDFYAQSLVRYCTDKKILVPNQVAVIGVDNSGTSEWEGQIPISSVELQLEKIGYTAMEVLAEIVGGKKAPSTPIKIPPKQIVVRASTELGAVRDELLGRALKLIGEQALKPLQISQIAMQLGVSRRLLEMRFHSILGRSPYAEVLRCRVEKAKLLLCDTDMTVSEIAYECGFEQPKLLFGTFKRTVGSTPTQFRANFRHPRP